MRQSKIFMYFVVGLVLASLGYAVAQITTINPGNNGEFNVTFNSSLSGNLYNNNTYFVTIPENGYVHNATIDIVAKFWWNATNLTSGLGKVGDNSQTAIAFNLTGNGQWVMIAGNSTNISDGFYWNSSGNNWISNSTLKSGLNIGTNTNIAPSLAFNLTGNGQWVAMVGTNSNGVLGYYWNSSNNLWIGNSTLNRTLPKDTDMTPSLMFNLTGNGQWVMDAGNFVGNFSGFYWNSSGNNWISNSTLDAQDQGVSTGGSSGFSVLLDGKWILFTGLSDGSMRAYVWGGTSWILNDSAILYPFSGNGMSVVASQAIPAVINNLTGENYQDMFVGSSAGIFKTFRLFFPVNLTIDAGQDGQDFNFSGRINGSNYNISLNPLSFNPNGTARNISINVSSNTHGFITVQNVRIIYRCFPPSGPWNFTNNANWLCRNETSIIGDTNNFMSGNMTLANSTFTLNRFNITGLLTMTAVNRTNISFSNSSFINLSFISDPITIKSFNLVTFTKSSPPGSASSNITITGNITNSTITGSIVNATYVKSCTIIQSYFDSNSCDSAFIDPSSIINSTVTGSTINNSTVKDSTLINSTLTGLNSQTDIILTASNITNSNITNGSNIVNVAMANGQIFNSVATAANLSNSTITNSTITNSNAIKTVVFNSTLTASNITNSNITNGNMNNVQLNDGNFINSTLTNYLFSPGSYVLNNSPNNNISLSYTFHVVFYNGVLLTNGSILQLVNSSGNITSGTSNETGYVAVIANYSLGAIGPYTILLPNVSTTSYTLSLNSISFSTSNIPIQEIVLNQAGQSGGSGGGSSGTSTINVASIVSYDQLISNSPQELAALTTDQITTLITNLDMSTAQIVQLFSKITLAQQEATFPMLGPAGAGSGGGPALSDTQQAIVTNECVTGDNLCPAFCSRPMDMDCQPRCGDGIPDINESWPTCQDKKFNLGDSVKIFKSSPVLLLILIGTLVAIIFVAFGDNRK